MRVISRVFVWVVVAMVAGAPLGAQAPVSASDLTQLDTSVTEVDGLVAKLKVGDPTLAADLQRTLSDVKDEVAYLKVKLRREGKVTREEYNAVRDRLETLRIKAQGPKVAAQPVMEDRPGRMVTVPVGTQFEVRMQQPLESSTAKVEDRFEATTLADVVVQGQTAIPAGSLVRGFVSSVKPAGKVSRTGSLTPSFDEVRIGETSFRLRASVVQALDPKMTEDVSKISVGAAAGGVVGGLIGGIKGALLGVLIGAGGTIAATEGSDVKLPMGAVLRIRVDQPLDVVVR
jgi:hypothetical protein